MVAVLVAAGLKSWCNAPDVTEGETASVTFYMDTKATKDDRISLEVYWKAEGSETMRKISWLFYNLLKQAKNKQIHAHSHNQIYKNNYCDMIYIIVKITITNV